MADGVTYGRDEEWGQTLKKFKALTGDDYIKGGF